ncbi:conserved hypothetical protein [Altererythrobacter sp. B11]|uniref:DUF1178 family protein n=1 Tax=Altererythrobacter sp. B11 TaxID=2060312 RepID=UPI000DC6F4BA|nr:DUF1178 family protein [Altererythrobacter sp. B11]BBC73048.1 conserved hypothetical protein [Altererythrobacter sp. B11]
MIVYDLVCAAGHRFEGWFGSSADYAAQHDGGLLSCPHCGSAEVGKAPMAAAVPKKGNQLPAPHRARTGNHPAEGESQALSAGPLPPAVAKALQQLAEAQCKALESSTWVGDRFAEQSRAMHYGERDAEAIHGRATVADAKALLEEGIQIAPLPFPVLPPDELN